MANYKYEIKLNEGGYIKYNINTEKVAIGDTLEINGVICGKTQGIADIRLSCYIDIPGLSLPDDTCQLVLTNKNKIKSQKGQEKSFLLQWSIVDPAYYVSSSGSYIYPLNYVGKGGVIWMRLSFTQGTDSYFVNLPNKLTSLVYHTNLRLLAFDVGRCNYLGQWDSQGTYLRVKNLKATCDSRTPTTQIQITNMSIQYENGDGGFDFFVPLTANQAIFTDEGYSDPESDVGRMLSYTLPTTTGGTVMIEFTDGYEGWKLTTARIPPAFARLHFSGAKDGGVAVGMFSSATDEDPKFEVAENHRAIFYGPVSFEGGVSGIATDYTLGEAATGGHWIDGKPIYRLVATTTDKLNASITVPSAVGTVIHLYGAGKRNDGVWFPLPAVHSTSFNRQVVLQFNPSTSVITVGSTGSDWTGSSGPYIVIMEYTKA